jgi:hypothetical protein
MKDTEYFEDNFGTRRKRKVAVKAVIALLDDIRNAESRSLANMPENFLNNESYKAGETAVDTMDGAIALLAAAY